MAKRALITGVTGQDGSYISELLLDKGYEVYGLVRRVSDRVYTNISHLLNDITLVDGDMTDPVSLMHAVQESRPDEVYNLAAQSFVGASWRQPHLTTAVTATGVLNILQALKDNAPNAKFYQASTSELFGNSHVNGEQDENTKMEPRSPYGFSKLYAFQVTKNYRESYGMFACNGILFNHESERRGLDFVTRKITDGVARMYHGLTNNICLGNLDARRDWGHAEDYVKAMWLMLQQDEPEEFVIATGKTHSVRSFVDKAFSVAGLDYTIEDLSDLTIEAAEKEITSLCQDETTNYIIIDPKYKRPAELHTLKGNPSKANNKLGWYPNVTFDQLVERMVLSDIARY